MQEKYPNQPRLLDMHAHLLCLSEPYRDRRTEAELLSLGVRELELRRSAGVSTVFSCSTPREYEFTKKCLAAGHSSSPQKTDECGDVPSFGIHPWHSGEFLPQDCRESFEECRIIGEIGMDSVWCDVPLAVQRRVFARQLEIAAGAGRPVILHTKGQEAQIAEMIRGFPGNVCVHWYSGSEADLEAFLEEDCYFTLGPDLTMQCDSAEKAGIVGKEAGVSREQQAALQGAALYRRMLREISADRLFLETDGISSVAWMRGQEIERVSFADIPAVLDDNLNRAAMAKGLRPEAFRALMWDNFQRFIR